MGLGMDPMMIGLGLGLGIGLRSLVFALGPLRDLVGPCSRKASLDRQEPLFVP